MDDLKQTTTARWRIQIVWLDSKRPNIDKKIYDLQDGGDGWIKIFELDRFDSEDKPHMTYEHHPKALMKSYKLIELTRPEKSAIIQPKAILTN